MFNPSEIFYYPTPPIIKKNYDKKPKLSIKANIVKRKKNYACKRNDCIF